MGGKSGGEGRRSLLDIMIALLKEFLSFPVGRKQSFHGSEQILDSVQPLTLPSASIARLKEAWQKLEPGCKNKADGSGKGGPTPEEQMLIERIRKETAECNRNNVTRTEAYRNVYFRFPELHWALLAHMVSRNGGWNMTDLEGEWLPRLLSEQQRRNIFLFLERANALIFGDAYPQLLLYEWSCRQGKSLFHLLPAFGVSVFMGPVWRQFWREKNAAVLTTALIVNEQHFIERRVVRDNYFERNVLQTLFSSIQRLLQLNAVVFPYGGGKPKTGQTAEQLKLAGIIMENMGDIDERIAFGKSLYAILFGVASVHEGVKAFAAAIKHTGSRGDYAPLWFEKTRGEQTGQGATGAASDDDFVSSREGRYFSPPLEEAWPDAPVDPTDSQDWFWDAGDVASRFESLALPDVFEITDEYRRLLRKLELAAAAIERSKT